MTGMDDLVTWLRAQMDDDERAALAWMPLGNPTAADRDHIARHDPTRVLAEVDAKRRILDAWETWNREKRESWADYQAWIDGGCTDEPYPHTIAEHAGPGLEIAMRLLALPYAGRDGWREEWRP